MFDQIIRAALNYRLLVITIAALMLAYGFQAMRSLPVDVFPDLNRPTVTIISEAEGLAPEEVETLVTFPIEAAMNGASGVVRVRSSSSIGFSIVYVEFDWDMEIYLARQIVTEKLNQVSGSLPENVQSVMGPVSSIMGEVMFIGVTSENADISPLDLRTIAEWDVKQRLLGISGVSKITAIGGDLKQYHVLVDPQKMLNYSVTLHQVREALENANVNTTGGFLLEPYKEHSIRNLGRIRSLEDLGAELLSHFCGDLETAKKAIEENHAGEHESVADFAQQLTEDTSEIPKHLEFYIDYERMGHDMELNGDIFTLELAHGEVHIFWNH
jgi:Cu/Ag efflux pump CusA